MKGFSLFLGLSLLAVKSQGALSRTYPTAATTGIRNDAYIEGIGTIYKSTYTINISTWTPFYNGSFFTFPDKTITGYIYKLNGSTWTLSGSTWTLQEYTDLILNQGKLHYLNDVIDEDLEQYMVFTSSFLPYGMETWKGWCVQTINGNKVPVACPK